MLLPTTGQHSFRLGTAVDQPHIMVEAQLVQKTVGRAKLKEAVVYKLYLNPSILMSTRLPASPVMTAMRGTIDLLHALPPEMCL